MRQGFTALVTTVAAISLVAGCATARDADSSSATATDETTTSPTPSSEPSATEEPARDAPAFVGDTGRQTGKGSGSGLVLVDVRVVEAEGFSRIVLEFSGSGTPGWVADYVDKPVLEGSGEVVDLGAGAVLDIYASGTTWPAPDYYSGPAQFTPRDGGDVDDVYVGGTFEGYTQVLAGIDGDPVPFRVFTLTGPARLIVDVVDANAE